MFSSTNLTIVQLLVLALISETISDFVPLEIPALQCTQYEDISHDISDVLKTVQEMLSSHTPSSHPLSCLEVKETSPSSPSGYYTLSDGNGNTNIVYCNMDDLYSCPSLEQALRGIQRSLDNTQSTITNQLDSIQDATNTLNTSIDNVLESQNVTNTLSTAINYTVNSVLNAQDYCNTLNTAVNNAVDSVLEELNNTQGTITNQLDSIQDATNTLNTSINNVLESQDVTNTLITAIDYTVNSVLNAQYYCYTLDAIVNYAMDSILVGQDYVNQFIAETNDNVNDVLNGQDYSDTIITAINDTVNEMLMLTQKLISLHPPSSCQEPETDFEDLCNMSGLWTRVAFLNLSDSTQNCPSPFEVYENNGLRACGRPHPLGKFTCESVTFPLNQTSYSQVCGRVTGYQYYSIDGFDVGFNGIDDPYVDGVSITFGYPRQHVWSFAAAKNIDGSPSSCPCAGGVNPPAFVGSDYFCESGSNGSPINETMYTSDPLWDGQGCVGGEATCCQAIGIPWFHKVLNASTTDFIELRICGFSDEDTPLSLYEIYVK